MFFVYILFSPTSNIYYVGSTNDYERRLTEHNSEENKSFTGKHAPWELKIALQCGEERRLAVRAERYIKSKKSRRLIERIINGEELQGVLAQLVRVPLQRD